MTENRSEHQSRKRNTHKFKHVTNKTAEYMHIKARKINKESRNIILYNSIHLLKQTCLLNLSDKLYVLVLISQLHIIYIMPSISRDNQELWGFSMLKYSKSINSISFNKHY